MTQTDEWRRNDDGSWSGTFDVDVKGAPVHISGTMSLSPVAAGPRHDVALDLQVKVPIIGGKIADLVGKRTCNARSTPSSRSTTVVWLPASRS